MAPEEDVLAILCPRVFSVQYYPTGYPIQYSKTFEFEKIAAASSKFAAAPAVVGL